MSAAMEIPEADRFPAGSRVVVSKQGDAFDGNPGGEYIIEGYVTAEERDDPKPYYMVEDPEGCLFGGCIPHDVLTLVRGPSEEAAENRMPTPEEIVEHVAREVHGGWSEVEVNESRRLLEASGGEWPERCTDFPYGVEFYGRRPSGKRFGCIVRITAMWEVDE